VTGPLNPVCYSKSSRFNSRKSETDNYETAAWAVSALLDELHRHGIAIGPKVYDPCCARGAILHELARRRPDLELIGSDIREGKRLECGAAYSVNDYLIGCVPEARGADVITNPPFTHADQFVLRALEDGARLVAILQRTQYMEGDQRYEALFRDHPETAIFHFVNRVSLEKEGLARLTASGMMTFSWFIWMAKPLWEGTRIFRLTQKADFTHDMRLAGYMPDGEELLVKDLLRYDRDGYMLFRIACPKCRWPIVMKPKRQKGSMSGCPECLHAFDIERPIESKAKTKFDGLWRVG